MAENLTPSYFDSAFLARVRLDFVGLFSVTATENSRLGGEITKGVL